MQLDYALKSLNEAGTKHSDKLPVRQCPQARPAGQERAHEAAQSSHKGASGTAVFQLQAAM